MPTEGDQMIRDFVARHYAPQKAQGSALAAAFVRGCLALMFSISLGGFCLVLALTVLRMAWRLSGLLLGVL